MEGLILIVGAVLGALLVVVHNRLQEAMDKTRSDVGELRREVQELAQGVQLIRAAMGISDKDFERCLEQAFSEVPDPGPAPDLEIPSS